MRHMDDVGIMHWIIGVFLFFLIDGTREHIALDCLGSIEIRQIEVGEGRAMREHALHIRNFRSVEIRKVESSQRRAIPEHAAHVSDLGGIEIWKVSEEQPENMCSVLWTLEVSKLDTSRVVSEEQPENM